MPNGELQPRHRAHRVPEDIGLLQSHRVHERRDVIRQILVGDGSVDVGGPAVPLQLERVDPMRLGELRNDLAHHGNVHIGAVQHDQRLTRTGHLVIHLHAVHLDPTTGRLGSGHRTGDEHGCSDECGAKHRFLVV